MVGTGGLKRDIVATDEQYPQHIQIQFQDKLIY
jgi:hypothetical protein